MALTPAQYKIERKLRGTQKEVAAKLGLNVNTVSKREQGRKDAPISREAELALLSLPKLKPKRSPS